MGRITEGPKCTECGDSIYLTAPDGHWTHVDTDNRFCNRGKSRATPDTSGSRRR